MMAADTRLRAGAPAHRSVLGWVLVALALVAAASAGVLVGQGGMGGLTGEGAAVAVALVTLAGSVGAGTALLATLGIARSRRNGVRSVDVEELAQATELRVEYAEEASAAVLEELREEVRGTLRALLKETREQKAALADFVASHQRVHASIDDALGLAPVRARPEQAAGWAADAPAPAGPATSGPIEPTQEAVDAALAAMAAEAGAPSDAPDAAQAFYAGGDDRAVDEVPGVSWEAARRLHALGIHTTAQLCALDADAVARRLRTWPNLVRHWQATAELMAVHGMGPGEAKTLHDAGLDLEALSNARPEDVARRLHVGPDDPRARTWVDEARRLVSR